VVPTIPLPVDRAKEPGRSWGLVAVPSLPVQLGLAALLKLCDWLTAGPALNNYLLCIHRILAVAPVSEVFAVFLYTGRQLHTAQARRPKQNACIRPCGICLSTWDDCLLSQAISSLLLLRFVARSLGSRLTVGAELFSGKPGRDE
jgi:hypothetical protein